MSVTVGHRGQFVTSSKLGRALPDVDQLRPTSKIGPIRPIVVEFWPKLSSRINSSTDVRQVVGDQNVAEHLSKSGNVAPGIGPKFGQAWPFWAKFVRSGPKLARDWPM